jgi:hypothetical protein
MTDKPAAPAELSATPAEPLTVMEKIIDCIPHEQTENPVQGMIPTEYCVHCRLVYAFADVRALLEKAQAQAPAHDGSIFLIESKHIPRTVYSAAICQTRKNAEEILATHKLFRPRENWHVVEYVRVPPPAQAQAASADEIIEACATIVENFRSWLREDFEDRLLVKIRALKGRFALAAAQPEPPAQPKEEK